ncbi:hypothetical protein EV193_105249 [Herbihabitans rhizosphaerae]|uniref:Peptidase inhibitor family I36 n=1 Tax=Herbihabitans rhizosphaerae TaxID=1872711 RepID=A0A4Q7KPS0_9PSEU|nr:hypothetical protein [Herbihabitans rhizosphaerae]RZS37691.1 hypothetical protein EV193_105249 [Herbihabitans rhizosphaerae]
MGKINRKIAFTLSGVALASGIGLAAPMTAQATPTEVRGGCSQDEYYKCGRIANHSSIKIKVTTNWGNPGGSSFWLKPGASAGGHGVDIDGFHVGKCGLYTEWGYIPANTGWVKILDYQGLDVLGSWC